MKKIISLILSFFLMFLTVIFPASAQDERYEPLRGGSSKVIACNGGGYLIISDPIVSINPCRKGAVFEIDAELFSAHYDSDNNLEWKYTLYATFEYEYGVSSVCTNAYYVQNIYKGNWTFSNGAAYTSANSATGTGRYVEKYLFITVNTIEVSLTMTCDVFGNVTS